jgi:OPA family sugar phosphate sensor protein UhpC-like MFS transporter
MGYTVGIAAMLLAFSAVPASMGALQWVIVFMIGFFLYGPQMQVPEFLPPALPILF